MCESQQLLDGRSVRRANVFIQTLTETDLSLLVTSVPTRVGCLPCDVYVQFIMIQQRNMLRLTAKATQFGRRTFTSWLIESAGTVPIKRRKDYADGSADNSDVMEKLMQVSFPLPRTAEIPAIINEKRHWR